MDDDSELAALMRESGLRREQGTDDSEETQSSTDRTANTGPQTRWKLFFGALMFLSQVFVEIGRRVLRLIELNVPRYIAFIDRCLVNLIRFSVHPRKQVSTLRFLLVIGFIVAIPYILVTMYRVQKANATIHGYEYLHIL